MPTGFKVDCVSSWSCLYVGEETSRGGQREGGGGGDTICLVIAVSDTWGHVAGHVAGHVG